MFKKIIFALVLLYVSAVFANDCKDCKREALADRITCFENCRNNRDPDESRNLFKASKQDCKSEYFSALAGCYDETSSPPGACT